MSRHRAGLVMLSLLGLAAAPEARADDTRDARDTGVLIERAMAFDEPGVIVALMDTTVSHDVSASRCSKLFARAGKARGAARAKLAACLAELAGGDAELRRWRDGGGRIELTVADGLLDVRLRRVGGKLRIAQITYRPGREEDDEGGVEGGIQGGEAGGTIGGVEHGSPPPPPPPPPPPAPPVSVVPQALEANRIAGDKQIAPDDATREQLQRDGKNKLVVPVKVCLATDGRVTSTQVLRSSGYPAYDARLRDTIAGTWRYRPYVVNGRPTAVCSVVNFLYQQR